MQKSTQYQGTVKHVSHNGTKNMYDDIAKFIVYVKIHGSIAGFTPTLKTAPPYIFKHGELSDVFCPENNVSN